MNDLQVLWEYAYHLHLIKQNVVKVETLPDEIDEKEEISLHEHILS